MSSPDTAARERRAPAPGHRRLIAAALFFLAAATYLPALRNGFTNYDDDVYVTGNPHVLGGLHVAGVRWALTAVRGANWHPLTWMSHMADCSWWGTAASGHHATSVLLHALNTVLLFLALHLMTRSVWRSAAVAALFAVHPLNVESVAWVAERKTVLCTAFWMLALIAWTGWLRDPKPARYLLALACFALGLAAKPMLVTLPFVLLLLDLWPFGRLDRATIGRLVLEKVPFFLLAAISCAITLLVQHRGRAVGSFAQYPLGARVANALVSWVTYAVQAIWPVGLSPFYPHPGASLPAWKVAGAAVLLGAAIGAAVLARRRHPYVTVGVLWFLGTLVPVIGLVQVGEQARADRYAYLPLIGLFVIAAWGVPDLTAGFRRRAAVVLLAVVLPAFAVMSARQAAFWHDSFTLFDHALAVNPRNATAHVNLAIASGEAGRTDEAIAHYRQALALKPDAPVPNNNLGLVLSRQGNQDEAMRLYRAALEIDPKYAEAHNNLGIALAKLGRTEEAAAEFASAVRLAPDDPSAQYNWGLALARARRIDESIAHFQEAIRLRPEYAEAHASLAGALFANGALAEAWREVELARRYGGEPAADLIRLLSEKMPEPRAP